MVLGKTGVWKAGLTSTGLSPLDKFALLDMIKGIQLAGVMLSADRNESCTTLSSSCSKATVLAQHFLCRER